MKEQVVKQQSDEKKRAVIEKSMGPRPKAFRKNRTGYERNSPVGKGVMYEHTPVLNPLLPVGSYAIIEELILIQRENSVHERTYYRAAGGRYRDIWGTPRIFKVTGYTIGIEYPLHPHNYVKLEYERADGSSCIIEEPTLYLASGSRRMVKVPPKETLK